MVSSFFCRFEKPRKIMTRALGIAQRGTLGSPGRMWGAQKRDRLPALNMPLNIAHPAGASGGRVRPWALVACLHSWLFVFFFRGRPPLFEAACRENAEIAEVLFGTCFPHCFPWGGVIRRVSFCCSFQGCLKRKRPYNCSFQKGR